MTHAIALKTAHRTQADTRPMRSRKNPDRSKRLSGAKRISRAESLSPAAGVGARLYDRHRRALDRFGTDPDHAT